MTNTHVELYTDGACSGNPGVGGFAAILVAYDEKGEIIAEKEITGSMPETTNNRMEMTAVIEGLKTLNQSIRVTVYTDSQYIINTMTKNWKRNKNSDLWEQIDELAQRHMITWKYVRGHAGHEYNERCDRLAVGEWKKLKGQL